MSEKTENQESVPTAARIGIFELILWRSRLLMGFGVVASVVMALGILYMAVIDTLYAFRPILTYGEIGLNPDSRSEARVAIVTNIIKATDSYLIAAILLLFALGLYELFINRLALPESSGVASRLLKVQSVNDLKDRVAKLILLVLVIEFFQYALRLNYTTPQDLLFLAGSIFLIGVALFVSNLKVKVLSE